MTRYEQTLNKIAPTFFKTIQYAKYFRSNQTPVNNFINFYENISEYYSSNKTSYALIVGDRRIYYNEPHIFYYTISLSKLNGFVFDVIYGLTSFITTMVINNFSFENKKIVASRPPLYLSLPVKDLFIRLVGKDMYDTIRENIK